MVKKNYIKVAQAIFFLTLGNNMVAIAKKL